MRSSAMRGCQAWSRLLLLLWLVCLGSRDYPIIYPLVQIILLRTLGITIAIVCIRHSPQAARPPGAQVTSQGEQEEDGDLEDLPMGGPGPEAEEE